MSPHYSDYETESKKEGSKHKKKLKELAFDRNKKKKKKITQKDLDMQNDWED